MASNAPKDSDLPRFDERREAILEEEIERALAPYRNLAPPALLKTMREALEEGLRTHPVPLRLLDHFAGARGPADRSGTVRKDDAPAGESGVREGGALTDQSGTVRKDGAPMGEDEPFGEGEGS